MRGARRIIRKSWSRARLNPPPEVAVYPAVNAWTFLQQTPPAEQITAAADAGFAGLELVTSENGPLRADTPLAEFRDLAARADDRGLRIVGVATAEFWSCNYASQQPDDRQRARDLTIRLLDCAAAARGDSVLVVPAVVGRSADTSPRVSYSDALCHTLEALSELRFEAEARRVHIAIENVWNRFLLSPLEMAGLIDEINSPWVGAYFDIGNVLALGYPQDWIATLGRRIVAVHAKDYDLQTPGPAGFRALGEGSVDWPTVIRALRQIGYDGPLTFEGSGEPADISRRLTNVIAGRPAIGATES